MIHQGSSMNLRKSAATVATAAFLTLGLTACGGQSVEDACQEANDDAREATSGLSGVSPSDPAASAETVDELQATLTSSADSLENEEVKTEVQTLADQFGELSGLLGDLDSAGEDPEALQEVSTQLTDLSTRIQDQAGTLNELCGA
jgi:hypothetical protein